MTEMSGGRAVVELLKAEGVRHVLGIVGSTVLDVFDNVANVARHAFRNIQRVLDGQPLPPADLVSIEP